MDNVEAAVRAVNWALSPKIDGEQTFFEFRDLSGVFSLTNLKRIRVEETETHTSAWAEILSIDFDAGLVYVQVDHSSAVILGE
jgi:hypothetical protein